VGNSIFRELVLDRLVHSYTDLNDPTNLQYGYEKTYAEVIRPVMRRRPTLDAFFIGGGGYTFPRYLEAMLPQSHLVVAEIDPGVTEIAHELLGLARDTRMQITNLDARIVLEMQDQPDSYDLVFGDAFNDYSVPFHLTTREFDQMVDRLLREDGLYVVNIIDGGKRGHFLRAYVRTLQQVFAHVAVIPSSRDWRDASRMTFVLVASQRPVDLSELSIPSGPTTESPVLAAEDLQAYLDQEPPLILTDEFVPVDNLLAPVFEDSHRG
jgi:spermidine synthase